MDHSQKSQRPELSRVRVVGARARMAEIAWQRQRRKCADCGSTDQRLRSEHRLVGGRREVRWTCSAGCGQTALVGAELEAAVMRIAEADPSLVSVRVVDSEPAQPVEETRRGRGRPRMFETVADYARARQRATRRLPAGASKAAIRREMGIPFGLKDGIPNGTFFRYERMLSDAVAQRVPTDLPTRA